MGIWNSKCMHTCITERQVPKGKELPWLLFEINSQRKTIMSKLINPKIRNIKFHKIKNAPMRL